MGNMTFGYPWSRRPLRSNSGTCHHVGTTARHRAPEKNTVAPKGLTAKGAGNASLPEKAEGMQSRMLEMGQGPPGDPHRRPGAATRGGRKAERGAEGGRARGIAERPPAVRSKGPAAATSGGPGRGEQAGGGRPRPRRRRQPRGTPAPAAARARSAEPGRPLRVPRLGGVKREPQPGGGRRTGRLRRLLYGVGALGVLPGRVPAALQPPRRSVSGAHNGDSQPQQRLRLGRRERAGPRRPAGTRGRQQHAG